MATNAQPTGHVGMQVASHTNPHNLPLNSDGKREWSHSFCGCFDECGTCLLASFCPCILYSQINTRINHLANHGTPHPSGGDSCSGACIGYVIASSCGLNTILQMIQRGNTRMRYNISGNGCTDLFVGCCCPVCDLVQEAREVELEEASYGKQSL